MRAKEFIHEGPDSTLLLFLMHDVNPAEIEEKANVIIQQYELDITTFNELRGYLYLVERLLRRVMICDIWYRDMSDTEKIALSKRFTKMYYYYEEYLVNMKPK